MNDQQNCHVESLEKPLDLEALPEATVGYLRIQGMGCPRCASRVRNGLLALEGTLLAEIFLEVRLAVVSFDPHRVRPGDLVDAVMGAGNDGRHRYQAQVLALRAATQAAAQEYLS